MQTFREYNEWIKQRSNMIGDFERIERTYEKQCEDIRNYVDMIGNLRKVVYKNIQQLGGSGMVPITFEANPPPTTMTLSTTSVETNSSRQSTNEDDNSDNPNKTFMTKIRGTTKKTIEQAQDGLQKLEGVIQQLRINNQKK